jgi:aldehyde:ferredoxin oxidoreductase
LPELLLQPLLEGGTEGHIPDMATLLKEYYAVRGWDWETGAPTPARLLALGMGEFVEPGERQAASAPIALQSV